MTKNEKIISEEKQLEELYGKIRAEMRTYKDKFISYVDMTLIDWIDELHNDLHKNGVEIKKLKTSHHHEKYVSEPNSIEYQVFTDHFRYRITADYPTDTDLETYFGCILNTRSPLKNETHVRMSDLSDGNFNLRTWKDIKKDIIENELMHKLEMENDKIEYENFELEPFEDTRYNRSGELILKRE